MRYLTRNNILEIAEYLNGNDDLEIALSELGFDPALYDEMEKWLSDEANMVRDPDTGIWRYERE